MISEFYFVNKSFSYPNGLSVEQLEERIKDLSVDYNYIKQYDSEKIFVHDSIYDEIIFPKIPLSEFLGFSPETKKLFNKQIITYLNIILRKSTRTKIEVNEVIEVLLSEKSQDLVHGLICLHKIEGIDKKFLVYNKNNWLDFHRYYLSIFPITSDFFIGECKKYFPELYFHPNNNDSIHRILNNNSKTIVKHLTLLNDIFPVCSKMHNNRIDLIKEFNVRSNFDDDCSIEGNLERKKKLNFSFKNSLGKEINVYCELHLKLLYDDKRKIVHNRIYFHEGTEDINDGKILVGHIGKHL